MAVQNTLSLPHPILTLHPFHIPDLKNVESLLINLNIVVIKSISPDLV